MGTIKKQLPRWSASEEDVLRQFVGKESAPSIGKRSVGAKGPCWKRSRRWD